MWRTRLPTIWKLRDDRTPATPIRAAPRPTPDDQSAERERQNHQKILVGVEYRFVDHKLDLERRREGGDLQNCRKRDHLGERASHASHLRPQTLQPDRGRGAHRTKAGRRRQLERDAGEMLETSARGSIRTPMAGSWITAPLALKEFRTTKWLRSQCNRRHLHLRERGKLDPQWPGQLVREFHQAAQRDPSHRQGKALAQAQVHVVAVKACNHCDAGKPAFGRFAG